MIPGFLSSRVYCLIRRVRQIKKQDLFKSCFWQIPAAGMKEVLFHALKDRYDVNYWKLVVGQSFLGGVSRPGEKSHKVFGNYNEHLRAAYLSSRLKFSMYFRHNPFFCFSFIKNISSLMPCFGLSWFSLLHAIEANSYFL